MYNRYISEDTPYVPIQEAEHPQGGGRSNSGTKGHGPASTGGFRFSSLFSGKEGLGALLGGKEGAGSPFSSGDGSGGLSGLLKALKLEDIDPGDILLLLIILFLLVEGDDLELVIALGLVLLMGLGDREGED